MSPMPATDDVTGSSNAGAGRGPALIETASDYVTASIPIFGPFDRAAEVRRALGRRTFDSAVDIAVCDGDTLLGLVTIECLLGADDDATLASLMDDTPPIVAPGLDQERAAWRAVQHGESSLAVVDAEGRFLGLIPPQRLLAVLLAEHEEDMARVGGFLHDSQAARRASTEPVGRRLWHRLPWLLVGLAGAMVASIIVSRFENSLEQQIVIAFFVPGIVYMADAVGTQTETLVIRGLSVGVPIGGVVRRELQTGFVIGVVLALLFFPVSLLVWREADVSLAVSLALFAACSTATIVAMALPWTFQRLRRDPAFGSGPLATVIQDLLSLIIYFSITLALVD
jgi:magnesium transporter